MMIYCKISFFIVLISVVCFSAAVKTQVEAEIDYHECKTAMDVKFEGMKSPHKCIQYAIIHMRLNGGNAFLYHKHLELYYKLFYKSVEIDSVILPEAFCDDRRYRSKKRDCLDELEVFKDPIILPDEEEQIADSYIVYPEGYLQSPKNEEEQEADSYIQYPDDYLQYPEGPSGVSSESLSEEPSSENILRLNVLKNALYHHVIYEPYRGHILPNDNDPSRKYFHKHDEIYGFNYLTDVSRYIKYKKDSLASPFDFCYNQYIKDIDEIEASKGR